MAKKLPVPMTYLALAELPHCTLWEEGDGRSPTPGHDSHSPCLKLNNISNINVSHVSVFFGKSSTVLKLLFRS